MKALEHNVEALQKTEGPLNPQNSDNQSEESTAEVFDCRRCDETFDSKKTLNKHMTSNHATKIDCRICYKIF
jgi:hypothetical protein